MEITKVVMELRRELASLDAAILSLERLQAKAPRRGRPPKLLSELRRPGKPPESTRDKRRISGASPEP
jgi:hypothetical protein